MATVKFKSVDFLRLIIFNQPQIRIFFIKAREQKEKYYKTLFTFKAFQYYQKNNKTAWYTVTCFDKNALQLKHWLKNGMVVYVSGYLDECEYVRNGVTQIKRNITAHQMIFDLYHNNQSLTSINFKKTAKEY